MTEPIKDVTPDGTSIQGDQPQRDCSADNDYSIKTPSELALLFRNSDDPKARQSIQEFVLLQDDQFQNDFQVYANNPGLIPLSEKITLGRQTVWTGDQLLEAEFKDPEWLVPDLIPIGLVSLAGKPKIGKSFLALQLAIAVGSGGIFLDKQTPQAKVMYLAFEDSPKRLQKRIRMMGFPKGTPVLFKTDYKNFLDGGLDDLAIDIIGNAFKLVVVDTFGRSIGKFDIKDYGDNVQALSPLQRMAQEYALSILLVDHHGKLTANENPIVDLIGSIGKSATFDAICGLYRSPGKSDSKLVIVSRDAEQVDLSIQFDPVTGCWQSLGDVKSHFQSQVLEAIKALTRMNELTTTANVAEHLDADRGNTSRAISMLVSIGKVRKLPKLGKEQPFGVIDD